MMNRSGILGAARRDPLRSLRRAVTAFIVAAAAYETVARSGIFPAALFPTIPPGTWAANMIGGYVVGLAVAFFAANPSLSPEWRLLLITGFCGGLTTFSTFSAETFSLLQTGRVAWALGEIAVHVVGSLLATAAGVLTYTLLGAR